MITKPENIKESLIGEEPEDVGEEPDSFQKIMQYACPKCSNLKSSFLGCSGISTSALTIQLRCENCGCLFYVPFQNIDAEKKPELAKSYLG